MEKGVPLGGGGGGGGVGGGGGGGREKDTQASLQCTAEIKKN